MPLENVTVQFGPNLQLFRQIDFCGGSVSWDTQLDSMESFRKATDPFQPFSSTFYWAAHPPQ